MSRFICLVLTIFLISFSAQARETQTTAPVSTISKEDIEKPKDPENTIYVSAARLPVLKQKQSSSSSNVTFISKEELKAKKSSSLQDALVSQEGVVLYDDVGNGLDSTLSLRGFNRASAVTFLVDGVRVNEIDGNTMTFPLVSMDDLESIQIERGSSAAVYGSNALAGVISITTGRPSKKPWSLFGGFDVASHRGIHFYQGVSGTVQDHFTPLGGAFEYYFKGGRNLGEGFRGNSEFRITSFDLKTAYVLPENSGKVYINAKHTDDMISNPGELTRLQYDASAKQTNKPSDARQFRNTIVQIGADKKFWDNKITASLMGDWRFNSLDFVNTTTQFGTNTTLVQSKSRTPELIGQLSYEDAWDWLTNTSLIGFEVRKTYELATRIAAPGGAVSPTAATSLDRDGHFFNSALFWNERLGLTKYADVNVGMRHDHYTLRTLNPKSPSSNYSGRWNDNTVSTGLTLHPLKSTDVFFQFSQGFRVPNLSDVNPFAGSTPPDFLKPETSNQYEVGTRYAFGDILKLRASWFLIDMQDEIVNDTNAVSPTNPFGQNINVGKSRRQGIETGMEVKPLREVSFFGTYTLTHAYVRETNVDAFGGQIYDGRDLGQVPQNRMTWGTEVNPLIRLGEPFAGLKFRVDGNFTGQQHPQGFESTPQSYLDATGGAGHVIKSFTLWNFLASYTFKKQEIYFKINNMFDNKYYSRAVVSEIFAPGTYPAGIDTFVNSGAPREYLMGMRWEIE